MLDKVEKSFSNQNLLLNTESNIEIDINKVNSKEVRNNVRKILKSKFGMYNNMNALSNLFIYKLILILF